MATDNDDTEFRPSRAERPEFRAGSYRLSSIDGSPPRFGRLAICVAAAAALTFGVMGTVAYNVWFNHDQQTYAEAIAGARAEFGSSTTGPVRAATPPALAAAPAAPAQDSGDTALSLAAADAPRGNEPSAPSALAQQGANATGPAAQQASARPTKEARLAPQRRVAPSNAKHSDNLFARVGQFFRRVSYRQHHSGRQQQDLYSHP